MRYLLDTDHLSILQRQSGADYHNLVARMAQMDARIAAIALSRQMILLTRNHRDFSKVAGLAIEDWTI